MTSDDLFRLSTNIRLLTTTLQSYQFHIERQNALLEKNQQIQTEIRDLLKSIVKK